MGLVPNNRLLNQSFIQNQDGSYSLQVVNTGAAGDLSIAQASEVISAIKCLIALPGNEVAIAEPDTLINSTVIGISVTAATTGNAVKYQLNGDLYDSSISFTEGTLLYLDTSGQITDIAPITGFQTKIGTAITNGININIEQPIEL
jgi:hypothetical protein